MKQRLNKRDRKSKAKNNKSGNMKWGWRLVNGIALLFILAGISGYAAPYISMHFQNNGTAVLNSTGQKVMFYSSSCSDCARVYPKVFWNNVRNFNEPSKQIQTVNLDAPVNKHFIVEEGLVATPTFFDLTSRSKEVLVNKTDVENYIQKIN